MNKLLKLTIEIVSVSVLIFSFSAPVYAKKINKKKKLQIAMSIDDLRVERWTKDRDFFIKAVKRNNAVPFVTSADASSARQIAQIQNFITRGVDAIVIVPFNGKVLKSVIRDAKEAGIKVVSYDRLIIGANIDAYITFDNEKVGEIQAGELVKRMPKGNYFLLGGSPQDNNAYMLRAGQEKVLAPYVKKGDIKIVGKQWTKDWMASEALKIIENVLTKNQNKIDAVVASNDGTAGGAIQALRAQGLTKTVVSGQDADLAGAMRVAKGQQTVTVYKPLNKIASQAAKLAIDLVKGNKVKYSTQLDNKYKKVNTVYLTPIPITKENINILIKDKVYTKKQLKL